MTYELKFTGTLEEIRALLNQGASHVAQPSADSFPASEEPVARPAPAKRGRPAAVAKPVSNTVAAPEQIDLEDAIAEREATPPAADVTKDQLRAKLIELMNVKGEEAPAALLSKGFGVAKIGLLDESHYADCFAKAQAAIDAEGE